MWEALEALFYYIRSKNKAPPTFLSLLLIAIVIIFSYESMKPAEQLTPAEIQTIEEPKESKEPQVTHKKETLNQLVATDLEVSQQERAMANVLTPEYQILRNFLEDEFQAKGIDIDLAAQLVSQIIKDFPNEGDQYDIRIPIRKVFRMASDDEIEEIRTLVLSSSVRSAVAYSGLAHTQD